VNRRHALRWLGAAAIAGAAAPTLDPFSRRLYAQAGIDWAARIAALPQPAADEIVIAAVGDLMISDPVTNRSLPEARTMYQVLDAADVAFANCEQAVASQGTLKGGFPQTAPVEMLDDWKASGLNMLAMANNHAFDLGEAGLFNSIDEARKRGFTVAGAGRNLAEATAPGIATARGQRVALLAFLVCPADFQSEAEMAEYRASATNSGIGLITGERVAVPGQELPLLLPNAADMRTMADAVRKARAEADVVMVSFHQHWNLDLPAGGGGRGRGAAPPPRTLIPAQLDRAGNLVAEGRRVVCRAAIDAGADIVIGHGPHVLNGVEMYKAKPIFYSLGHFYLALLKDGRALPRMQMSPSLVRLAETNYYLEEHRWGAIARIFVRRGAVSRIQVLPVWMDVQKDGLPMFPSDADARKINEAMQELSRPFSTRLRAVDWYSEIVTA
jgi:poly-gamma-glutamate capsule biosynthesis protein CapA/YwtB (metallophosphatase superfamily)